MLYAQIKLNSMQLLSSFNNLLQAPILSIISVANGVTSF